MTKFAIILAVTFSASLFSSCSTIYFEKGSKAPRNLEYGEWHHDGVLGLVEFSNPVDMSGRCDGKDWASIKVEKSFVQGFVTDVTRNLYDPWDVTYSCKKN